MLNKQAKGLLSRFLTYTEKEVLDAFAYLQGAIAKKEYVYVPGGRKDRILLVAHADTVNEEDIPTLLWMGDVCSVKKFWHDDKENKNVYPVGGWKNSALGADDRAGCAMLWQYQDVGHSLLITTGEESGLKGARAAARELKDELAKHNFALEIDRRGDRQAVFYDIATEEFKKYALGLLSASDPEDLEWQEYNGSCTDIKHICDEVQICGVNVSAGYLGEHGVSEMLFMEAWLHTRDTLSKFLKAEHLAFKLPPKRTLPPTTHAGMPERLQWRWCTEHTCYMDKCQTLHEKHSVNSGSVDLTTLNSRVGKSYQTRIFRVKGDKPGEGTVELRQVIDGQDPSKAWRVPSSLSKRQSKKLSKVIVHMLGKGKLNQDEATKLMNEIIRLRDMKEQDIRVTEEQRTDAASGIHPQERESDAGTRRCPHGYLPGAHCIKCPNNKASLVTIVYDGDQYGEKTSADGDAAIAIALSAARNGTNEDLPAQTGGIYDLSSGRCWHNCFGKHRWYHSRKQKSFCRLSYNCFCPDHGSPVVLNLIDNAAWGVFAITAKVESGAKITERVACQHHCHMCGTWRHVKPCSGKCSIIGGYDARCPIHDKNNLKVVAEYERICKIPGWASTLPVNSTVSDDPSDTEPAKGDVSQISLLTDGKTGSGLKADSQREGEL